MATWPAKINYATGDVLTAAQMNDIGGELNDLYNATGGVGRNPVLNSNYSIWQRGTSISVAAGTTIYTADRFMFEARTSQASTVSRQATGDTTNLPNIQYCARVQRNSGQTGTFTNAFSTSFESINSIPFAGKPVTLSFYARKGADYSSAGSGLTVNLYTGTGTDQNIGTGAYTGSANPISQTATLTTTWQRFTYSATLSASLTEIALVFSFAPTGTAGAADYYEITGVQLDVGSVALPYKPNGATYQAELAACQRYYYLHTSGTSTYWGNGMNYSATQANGYVQFPATMRTAPSLVATSGTNYYEFVRNGAGDTFNSLTILSPNTTGSSFYNNSEISGTAGHAGIFYSANASASVAFNAEL